MEIISNEPEFLYYVVGRGIGRLFISSSSVSCFLLGKNVTEYKVFKLVKDIPNEIFEMEKYLDSI